MDITAHLSTLAPLLAFGVLANALAFAAVGMDKRRTTAGFARIPARILILLATLGGWFGAMLGQMLFRPAQRARGYGLAFFGAILVLPTAIFFLTQSLPEVGDKIAALVQAQLADYLPAASTEAAGPSVINTKGPLPKKVTPSAISDSTQTAPALPHRFGPGSDTPMTGSLKKPAKP